MKFEVQHEGSSSRAGQTQAFDSDHVVVGRGRQCQLAFDPEADKEVSGKHGELLWVAGRLTYRDVGSTNGSFLNGTAVTGAVHVRGGDLLQLGQSGPVLRFLDVEGTPPPDLIPATVAGQAVPGTQPGAAAGQATIPPAAHAGHAAAAPAPAQAPQAAPTQIIVKKGGGAGWFVAILALGAIGAGGYFVREELNGVTAEARAEIDSARSEIEQARADAQAELNEVKTEARQQLDSAKAEAERRTDEARIAGELLSRVDLAPLLAQGMGEEHAAAFQALELRYREIVDEAREVSADSSLSTADKQSRLESLQVQLNTAADDLAKLQEVARVQALEKVKEDASRPNDWSQLATAYADSIFLVVVQYLDDDNKTVDGGIGTAFVVDSSGVLGTNAHVAEMLTGPLAKGSTKRLSVVVQNSTGLIFNAKRALQHPGYDRTNSPDVALIWFDTKHKVKGEVPVKALPLASEEELRALSVGQHLGTLGFPGELSNTYLSVIDGDNMVAPRTVATFKDGWITRVTDFQGTAGTNVEEHYLIHHSASTSGGTSGSPMFDGQGRVVALNNAGMDLDLKGIGLRTPSASELAQAIRADLLQDLIDEHVK